METASYRNFTMQARAERITPWRPPMGLVIMGLAVVVLIAATLILLRGHSAMEAKFTGKISDLFPSERELIGWVVIDAPIADTPEMKRRVNEVLNYDDAGYRIYTKGNQRISVYLAYWHPGKMLVRSVAHHTPDVCWTLAGWQCTQRDTITGVRLTDIDHAEHRIFRRGDQIEHVVFWHLAGGEVVSYNTGWMPPWHATITDTFKWGLEQKQEQIFLRISSNQPLADFWDTDVVQIVVSKTLGITKGK